MNPETICNRCLSLVGLPDVVILDVEDVAGAPLRVHVELTRSTHGCPRCGVVAHVKDRRRVELVDLPMAGRPMRLVWVKRRFRCPESSCPMGSWTEDEPRIASRRLMMTDRAGRWITEQVGRNARSVSEVARELGCDWPLLSVQHCSPAGRRWVWSPRPHAHRLLQSASVRECRRSRVAGRHHLPGICVFVRHLAAVV